MRLDKNKINFPWFFDGNVEESHRYILHFKLVYLFSTTKYPNLKTPASMHSLV